MIPDPDDKSYFWDGAGYVQRWGGVPPTGPKHLTDEQREARRKRRARKRQRKNEARNAALKAALLNDRMADG